MSETKETYNGRVIVSTRKLTEFEFGCTKCGLVHTKSSYAIAQIAMNVAIVFTCTCGNKIDM